MNEAAIKEDVNVMGTRYHKRAADFAGRNDRQVYLKWETDNEWDHNAIQVMGTWTDSSGKRFEGQLGYVPKELAEEIANAYGDSIPLGATIKNIHDPGYPVPEIRIDIRLEDSPEATLNA